jgi:hypothetical protein
MKNRLRDTGQRRVQNIQLARVNIFSDRCDIIKAE